MAKKELSLEELENRITFSLYSIELEKLKIQNYKKLVAGRPIKPMFLMKQLAYKRAMAHKDIVIPACETLTDIINNG